MEERPEIHEYETDTVDKFRQPIREESAMPVTKENLRSVMSYHQLDEQQKKAYERIEDAAVVFANVVLDVLPPCGDQQAAIRHIFEAKATANRGVAVKGMV